MAFSQGQLITAAELNNIGNTVNRTYAEGHAGWTYVTKNYYFYSTRLSGHTIMRYTSRRSAGCNHEVILDRWENGAWVRKDRQQASGGLKEWYVSAGIGAYHVYLRYHNNTPTTVVFPTSNANVVGNHLAMLSHNPINHTDASVKTVSNRSHDVISVTALNEGRVYTL